MYLHLGLDVMIETKKIIGIFDLKSVTRDFIKNIEIPDKYNSCILTLDGVFFSEISSVTLLKRSDSFLK